MTSAAPARKPYRKAPPQHRETRQSLPAAAPPPAPQHDINQVNLNTPSPPLQRFSYLPPAVTSSRPQSSGSRHGDPLPLSESELDVSSLSSLELCIPPPPLFGSNANRPNRARTKASGNTSSPHHEVGHFISGAKEDAPAHRSPAEARKHSPGRGSRGEHHSWTHRTQTAAALKSILKQPAMLGVEHAYDTIRKSKSVELLDNCRGPRSSTHHPPACSPDRSEQREPVSRRSSAPSSAPSSPSSTSRTDWNMRIQTLEEKVRFSNFLDEITCRVLSPAHLTLFGKCPGKEYGSPTPERRRLRPAFRKPQDVDTSADRTRRWDDWVASVQRPDSWYQPLHGEGAEAQQGVVPEGAGPKEDVPGLKRGLKMGVHGAEEPQRHKHKPPVSNQCHLSHNKVG